MADEPSSGIASKVSRLTRAAAGVRGRSTLLAAAVVAVALVIGGIAMLALYRNQLMANLDTALQQQVDDRVRLLDGGASPQSLATAIDEESLVWIGTVDGVVLAQGGSLRPVEAPKPLGDGNVATVEMVFDEIYPGSDGAIEREEGQVRLASGTAMTGVIVVAGTELEAVDEPVAAIGQIFAFAVPPLVALVAGLTWLTTGRALMPVENIRSKAAEITGANLAGRVPVPATRDEVARLATTVNEMLERIESHEYSLRQFTADASHELKSPVANLRALVDTTALQDDQWPAVKQHLVGETDRLKDLVENLLFLASHQAGRPVASTDRVALDELLFVEAELVAATGTVTVDLNGVQPAEVIGSSTDLGRLVRNLVDNAARHARSKIMLAIETNEPTEQEFGEATPYPVPNRASNSAPNPAIGSSVTLLVGDDGPGIAEGDRLRVFERFARLDDARNRSDGGAGLGLSIVQQIADSHQATVVIETSPLGGAEFRVRFTSR